MSSTATEKTSPPAAKRRRQTRAERSETTRRALVRAAAEVVGEMGYSEASVARITMRAKVAQGTFYNYFESRQDLFDQLLPSLGASMLEHIAANVDREAVGAEREEQRIRAYFDFLAQRPEFYRILYEAETLAPRAHKQHMQVVTDGYVRALTRSWERGEMPGYDGEDELEVVAYVLLAARGYLSMRYGVGGKGGSVPEWVVRAYSKFVRNGLFLHPLAETSERAKDPVQPHPPRKAQAASARGPLDDR